MPAVFLCSECLGLSPCEEQLPPGNSGTPRREHVSGGRTRVIFLCSAAGTVHPDSAVTNRRKAILRFLPREIALYQR